jgi:restriction endonuclease Mrr
VLKGAVSNGLRRADGAVEHTGRSEDGGIDGIIRQDPLGLDRVYLQRSVMRPTIQSVGTTSRYAKTFSCAEAIWTTR